MLHHLHVPNKNVEHSSILTHGPSPVLPPCFRGPLRVLEMSSKMQ